MNEIAIKRHNFDVAKNRLKEFSEGSEPKLEIDKVQTEGSFFGLGDHKVTGYELNRRIETIQELFIDVNTINSKVIKELREFYNVIDVLDKEYITSIVANVKAIEKTSNDVRVQQGTLKQHNEKLANQQRKLDTHQVEIERNVANISKIVTALKEFKKKLEGYKHLTDIDKIWNDCNDIQKKISEVSDKIKKATEDISTANDNNKALSEQVNRDIYDLCNRAESSEKFFSEMYDDLNKNIKKIEGNIQTQQTHLDNLATTSKKHTDSVVSLSGNLADAKKYAIESRNLITELQDFKESLSALNHLMEIDKIWEKNEDYQRRIDRVEQEDKSRTEKLSGISHLDDVDAMWKDVEEHTSKLIECEKRNEKLADTIQENKEEVNKNIEAVHTANIAIETLTKKVKYAYWIAGGSVGLAIIELILLLIKVI